MYTSYEKNNNLGFETDSKTKSSSIKDEKEINYKKKKKIKRNKTSLISSNSKNDINHQKIKGEEKIYLNKNNTNIIQNKKQEKKYIIPIKKKNIKLNHIQNSYNLQKNNFKTINNDDLKNSNELKEYKILHNIKTYENFNNKNNTHNSFNLINKYFNYKKDNMRNFISRFNEKQIPEDDFKKYTVSYRDKMVKESKVKLNIENIADESLTELRSEKFSSSFIKDNFGNNKSQYITKSNKEGNFKKLKIIKNIKKYNCKYISNDCKNNFIKLNNNFLKNDYSKVLKNNIKEDKKNKTEQDQNILNKMKENKNNGIKNYTKSNIKNDLNIRKTKTNLLIKNLIIKINKKRKVSLTNNNLLNLNNKNKNHINDFLVHVSIKNSFSKEKNKELNKNKEIINNNIINKTLNDDYFKKSIKRSKIHKNFGINSINNEKKITPKRFSIHYKKKGCVIKRNYNITDILSKNQRNISLNNIIKDKINKNSTLNKKIERNSLREMLDNNLKNQIKYDENKKYLNDILIKDNKNKTLMTSFIKKDKRKRNLLNNTINSINKDFSFYIKNSIKSNHNIPKKKEPQNIYMNYFKKKKKIAIQVRSKTISSSFIEEYISNKDKDNIKNYTTKNNYEKYIDFSSVINKNDKSTNFKRKNNSLNINDFYNYNNYNKRKKTTCGKIFKSNKKIEKNKNNQTFTK